MDVHYKVINMCESLEMKFCYNLHYKLLNVFGFPWWPSCASAFGLFLQGIKEI